MGRREMALGARVSGAQAPKPFRHARILRYNARVIVFFSLPRRVDSRTNYNTLGRAINPTAQINQRHSTHSSLFFVIYTIALRGETDFFMFIKIPWLLVYFLNRFRELTIQRGFPRGRSLWMNDRKAQFRDDSTLRFILNDTNDWQKYKFMGRRAKIKIMMRKKREEIITRARGWRNEEWRWGQRWRGVSERKGKKAPDARARGTTRWIYTTQQKINKSCS